MANMDGWDIVLLIVAGYVAVTALVRPMIRHRDQVRLSFRHKVKRPRRGKAIEDKERQPRESPPQQGKAA